MRTGLERGSIWSGIALIAFLVAPCPAQCPDQWRAVTGSPGANGGVNELAVLANGDLLAAGNFQWAGTTSISLAGRFHAATRTWTSISSGSLPGATALLPLPNGDIIVAGGFTSVGGVSAARIARFSAASATWHALGSGLEGQVFSLAALPNGDIVAGGIIPSDGSGTTLLNNIARFDSLAETWVPMGGGVNDRVFSIVTLPSGDIVAGGPFTQAGSVTVPHRAALFSLASGAWMPLGGQASGVGKLILSPDGSILGLGGFQFNGGSVFPFGRFRFETGTWEPAIPVALQSADGSINDVIELPGGDLVAGGTFQMIGGVPARRLARYHQATQSWAALGSGIQLGTSQSVNALALLPTGEVIVGGQFTGAGDKTLHNIASVDPDTGDWSALTPGTDGNVFALLPLDDGSVIAGGTFSVAGGTQASNIVRVPAAGHNWVPLGAGVQPPEPLARVVSALGRLPNGDLIAAGVFSRSGEINLHRIARYAFERNAWEDLGALAPAGINGGISALLVLSDGSVIVGGTFATIGGVAASNIARLDPTTLVWSPLSSSPQGEVTSLALLPSGDLVVGGGFTQIGTQTFNRIARYNFSSATWSSMGSGISGTSGRTRVFSLQPLANGDVLAGGNFTMAGGIAIRGIARYRFDTNTWSRLGTGLVGDVASIGALSPTRFIVSGSFGTAGGLPVQGIAIHNTDSGSWSALASQPSGASFGPLVVLPGGDVLVAGTAVFNGQTSTPLARYSFAPGMPNITSPPVSGSQCVGSPTVFRAATNSAPETDFQWQIQGASGEWENLNDPATVLDCGGTAAVSGSSSSEVAIVVGGCTATFQIRCQLVNECGTTTSDPVAFLVCPANINCDSQLDADDLADYINCYFAVPLCERADFNGDANVDADDLGDYINAYFAGCP